MILEFANLLAQFLREPRPPGRVAENGKLIGPLREQRAQHHDAPLFGEKLRNRLPEFGENESRQTFERKNLQPRVPRQFRALQQLPLKLVSRLLRREKNECRPFRTRAQLVPNLIETSKRFACARGSEKERNLHFPSSIG